MKIFAIKNIHTGLFLENGPKMKKTRAKFSTKPRLFLRKADAVNCMKCWCMGIWHQEYYEGEGSGPMPPDKKPEDRKLEDLIIVETECEFK